MDNTAENEEIASVRKFSFSQWTRSSGRVIRNRTEQALNKHLDTQNRSVRSDLMDIYYRFLKIHGHDSQELVEAVTYNLKLLESDRKKSRFFKRTHGLKWNK